MIRDSENQDVFMEVISIAETHPEIAIMANIRIDWDKKVIRPMIPGARWIFVNCDWLGGIGEPLTFEIGDSVKVVDPYAMFPGTRRIVDFCDAGIVCALLTDPDDQVVFGADQLERIKNE